MGCRFDEVSTNSPVAGSYLYDMDIVFLIMVQKYSGETNWLFAPPVVTHFPNGYEKSTSIFSIPVVSNDAS